MAAQPVLVRFYLIIGKLCIFGQIYVATSFLCLIALNEYIFQWKRISFNGVFVKNWMLAEKYLVNLSSVQRLVCLK